MSSRTLTWTPKPCWRLDGEFKTLEIARRSWAKRIARRDEILDSDSVGYLEVYSMACEWSQVHLEVEESGKS